MDPAPPGAMPSMASTLRAPVSGVCPPPSTGVSATGSASAVAYPDRASLDCPGRTCSRHGCCQACVASAAARQGSGDPACHYNVEGMLTPDSRQQHSSALEFSAYRHVHSSCSASALLSWHLTRHNLQLLRDGTSAADAPLHQTGPRLAGEHEVGRRGLLLQRSHALDGVLALGHLRRVGALLGHLLGQLARALVRRFLGRRDAVEPGGTPDGSSTGFHCQAPTMSSQTQAPHRRAPTHLG